jgi:hypothetical protein
MKKPHLLYPQLAEWPHHFVVEIHGVEKPLFDEPIFSPRKSNQAFLCTTPELWTPKGLPIAVVFCGKQGFSIWSGDTRLLSVATTDLRLDVRMVLPTDELLWAHVEIRP